MKRIPNFSLIFLYVISSPIPTTLCSMKSSSSARDSKPIRLYPDMDWKAILISALVLSSVPLVFFLPSSNPFRLIEPISTSSNSSRHENQLIVSYNRSIDKEEECDLFVGRWVAEPRGSLYSNVTCPAMPDPNNCGRYGKGLEHAFWRWKPDRCELPRFDPSAFLGVVRGKKMAVAGDSVARNHFHSLLCLLSQAEAPINTYRNTSDMFQQWEKLQIWHFPSHDFTLMLIWAEYLVSRTQTQRTINGVATNTYDLDLDSVNPTLAQRLPELDYLVISAGNWFIKKAYLHENGRFIGCVNCGYENLTHLTGTYAVRRVIRTVLEYVSRCEECSSSLRTFLRTYSPTHFEHGAWFNGGYCNRTRPLNNKFEIEFDGHELEYNKVQLEEIRRIRDGNSNGNRSFEVLDVTNAMMLRADGHPGSHWRWMNTSNSDCLHWCLPGPIDMWSEMLLATLQKNSST